MPRSTGRYVICVRNGAYRASLEPRKVYRVLDDPAGRQKARLAKCLEVKVDVLLAQKDFPAAERTILDFIATYDAHQAHPFTWRTGASSQSPQKPCPAATRTTRPFIASSEDWGAATRLPGSSYALPPGRQARPGERTRRPKAMDFPTE